MDMQHLAAIIPPHTASAAVLTVASTLTLAVGLRQGRAAASCVAGVLYVEAWAAVFWALSIPALRPLHLPALVVVWSALAVYMALTYRERVDPRAAGLGARRGARLYLAVAVSAAALLLLYHLGTYCGALQTWEAPVVGGFPENGGFGGAFMSGQGMLAYAAQRLIWDEGVLSAGHTSLFYGAPTYGLFHLLGFSAWTLRFPAVIATLLSIGVAYAIGRRFFGPVVAGGAAMAFGLNCCVLFYGRYGSSPAGTLLAVLLALWGSWLFLAADRPPWWLGVLCALALFTATLQYSTGRLVVVLLLGFVGGVLAVRWRRLTRQQIVGGVTLALAAIVVWQFEAAYDAQHTFVMARGEQYLQIIEHPEYIRELFGKPLFDHELTADSITFTDEAVLLYRMLQTTVPQLVALMRPTLQVDRLTDIDYLGRLPQLYYAPIVVFILWGVAHSLMRLRRWTHACLAVLVVAGVVPLLLTNRVDAHRGMLLVVPLGFWAALGVWEAARVMTRAGVAPALQHVCAAAFALTVLYSDVYLLHPEPAPDVEVAHSIVSAVEAVRGPVTVGALLDDRELGWIELALLERTRRDPGSRATLLRNTVVRKFSEEAGTNANVGALRQRLDDATIVLAPADQFRTTAARLREEGVSVTEIDMAGTRLLRLETSARRVTAGR